MSGEHLVNEFGRRVIERKNKFLETRFAPETELSFDYPPETIDIHLGYKGTPCSLKCIWCFDKKDEIVKPLKWTPERVEQFDLELDKVVAWEKDGFKVEQVYLAGGGEPTLYPKISSMVIDKFSAAGRKVWLTTNGVDIKEPALSSMIEGGTGILVSMPGSNRESYKENTEFDYFEKVLSNLRDVVDRKKSSDSTLELDVTHVLMPNTIDHLEPFILELNNIGVDEFRMRYDIFSDPKAEHNVKGLQIVREILEKHPDLDMKIVLKSPQEEALSEQASCFSPFLWPTWNPLHGVFPCAHATDENNRLPSEKTNGVFSLVNMDASLEQAQNPDCHRRCPSTIHWLNIHLNQQQE